MDGLLDTERDKPEVFSFSKKIVRLNDALKLLLIVMNDQSGSEW